MDTRAVTLNITTNLTICCPLWDTLETSRAQDTQSWRVSACPLQRCLLWTYWTMELGNLCFSPNTYKRREGWEAGAGITIITTSTLITNITAHTTTTVIPTPYMEHHMVIVQA